MSALLKSGEWWTWLLFFNLYFIECSTMNLYLFYKKENYCEIFYFAAFSILVLGEIFQVVLRSMVTQMKNFVLNSVCLFKSCAILVFWFVMEIYFYSWIKLPLLAFSISILDTSLVMEIIIFLNLIVHPRDLYTCSLKGMTVSIVR